MITNAIIGLVTTVVSFIDGLLPSFTMPTWLTTTTFIPSAWAQFLGMIAKWAAPVFPSDLVLSILVALSWFWPIVVAYTIFQWIYTHLPTIAGFGLGSGG